MAKLQLVLASDGGQIDIFGKYDQDKPLFLERVNVTELDAGGLVIGTYATVIHEYFGPGQGTSLLYSHTPTGANVKQVKASGYYINIDQIALSNTVAL